MPATTAILLALLPIASAHFALNFPAARGDDDTDQATLPCGGYPDVAERTSIPLDSIPLSMELGHTENYVSVFLAIGNEPGESFNVTLWPTVLEQGPGDFCWQAIPTPENITIEEGTNGTVQVITNGHHGSGLYNCADITFISSGEQPSSCAKGTGITAEFLEADTYIVANATAPEEEHGVDHGDGASASGSATGSAEEASATGEESGSSMLSVGWAVLGAGVMGAVALM